MLFDKCRNAVTRKQGNTVDSSRSLIVQHWWVGESELCWYSWEREVAAWRAATDKVDEGDRESVTTVKLKLLSGGEEYRSSPLKNQVTELLGGSVLTCRRQKRLISQWTVLRPITIEQIREVNI